MKLLIEEAKAEPAKPPVEKQAWQMTRDEFTEKWIECSNCFGLVPDKREY